MLRGRSGECRLAVHRRKKNEPLIGDHHPVGSPAAPDGGALIGSPGRDEPFHQSSHRSEHASPDEASARILSTPAAQRLAGPPSGRPARCELGITRSGSRHRPARDCPGQRWLAGCASLTTNRGGTSRRRSRGGTRRRGIACAFESLIPSAKARLPIHFGPIPMTGTVRPDGSR
jgi:hypothetical protein